MKILIGVDEAGYGPNLGPLAVAATAWRVEAAPTCAPDVSDGGLEGTSVGGVAGSSTQLKPRTSAAVTSGVDLYRLLGRAVARSPAPTERSVAIADSKALYSAGKGLDLLERGVLAAVSLLPLDDVENRGSCASTTDLHRTLAADDEGHGPRLPWHAEVSQTLPAHASRGAVDGDRQILKAACSKANVALAAVRARLVHPLQFNELCEKFGTKGAALSHVTLALVREVVEFVLPDAGLNPDGGRVIHITCDKHGGRNRYAGLLQHHFTESWIEVVIESRAASRYRWRYRDTEVDACFRVGGEAELPAALASMTAKYLRELAMFEFNAFWAARIPGLAPTAGYPVDARRYKLAIADEQARLGVDDRILWRQR